MGIVTDYLVAMITRQVERSHLILWFDPEKHYQTVANQLTLDNTMVLRYEGSFFALRHQAEPLINGTEPPRLVIYLPLKETETENALIELECMGGSMKPSHSSLACNTRLSLIARYALKPIIGEGAANNIEKQVAAGKFTLTELDMLAGKGEGITSGTVAIIFDANNAQEIALSFLNTDQYDATIESRDALPELAQILHETFEITAQTSEKPDAYRHRLARYILATDLMATLTGDIPVSLASIAVARQLKTREACTILAHTWRLRRDLAEGYESHAKRVEQELGLRNIPFEAQTIARAETFLTLEKKLQESIALALQERATDVLLSQARARQSCFWSEYQPEIQATWALVVVSGQILREAERIEQALKIPSDVGALFAAYTDKHHPWCLLDTYHRHMERRYHDFSFPFTDGLLQLLTKARQRYMEIGASLAENFLQRFLAGRFRIEGVLRQVEIFDQKVKPHLLQGKVAYVWVDALRYEMAYELAQTLAADADPEMEAALGTVPTITPIGMAALLPGAQKTARVVTANDGKVALEIAGDVIKDRRERIAFLRAHTNAKVFEAKLDDLLPQPSKRVSDGIHHADLILITSQEIDLLGEEDNIPIARRTMDEVLRQLKQAFHILGQKGVKTIIFTADHGYLFGDELSSDMKIDLPKGNSAERHRRVWVGQGGEVSDTYLRAHISDFGFESDLDIAVPWGFGCFKVRGGTDAYFHGGMSPQELIIPVVTLKPRRNRAGAVDEISWTLALSSKKISTRICSVQITGKGNSLFALAVPKVCVEIRHGQTCLSVPAGASYGFDELTGDVELKLSEDGTQNIETNRLTLLITQVLTKATVSIHLLDSTSGIELASVNNVEMAIAL
jgi:hypothetical protein